jgi:hypothetical protein
MSHKMIVLGALVFQLSACSSSFFGNGVAKPNVKGGQRDQGGNTALNDGSNGSNSNIPSIGVGEFKEGEWHLTFKHLDLAQVGLDEEAMNYGLAKAFNSVSQVSEVIQLPALPGGLSYSVDPNKFGLTSQQQSAVESCSFLKTTQVDGVDFWEADTFMYCILEPRIYYQMMGISRAGNMERATERKFAAQRTSSNHSMVAVVDSPVANGNDRMMERIERPDGGVFWGTGDYLFPRGIASAKQAGTFPAGDQGRAIGAFKAGEFMWEMDNGFIGFALSGFGAQPRYEANRRVASDPGRNDGFVIAGYGCMGCHSTGYNAGEYTSDVGQGSQTADYPSKDAFEALIAKDNARYKSALMKLGYSEKTIYGPDPITAIINHFESRTGTKFREGGAFGAIPGSGGGFGGFGGFGN